MTKKDSEINIGAEKKKKAPSQKKKRQVRKKQDKSVSKEIKAINPEHYFFLRDGRVLKDLFELAESLESMHTDIFSHHVNEAKNDFSNWIKDIFENHDLAQEIYIIKDPRQTQLIILKHIAKEKRD